MYEFNATQPIYLQLMDAIKRQIAAGRLDPGGKIDSVRELASAYGVNPNTAQRALNELEREGLLSTQRTNGKFVTEDTGMIQAMKARLAAEYMETLISAMENLGFHQEETLAMISAKLKER